jgi:hypothetical protein
VTAPYVIWTVALYEAKVLLRAWSFRIFALVGLVILVIMNIAFGTKVGQAPYFFYSLAGSLPMMNIKLLTVYQGIIAAFLASDFIKRDHRHDSTEVIYMRSMTNADYILGKTAGILFVFAILNGIVLLLGFLFHLLLSRTPFAWQPYIYYTLLMSLPVLVFMIGVASMLMNLVRSQAVVFVLLLGASVASLVFVGQRIFSIFDIFAFHMPMMYSDFIGMGNLDDLLAVRGAYFLLGSGLIALSIVLIKRLRQSKITNIVAGVMSAACIAIAVALSLSYLNDCYAAREYRAHLRALNSVVKGVPVPMATDCLIRLDHDGRNLNVATELRIENHNSADLDSLLFTINPGLKVTEVSDGTRGLEFRQEEHLLWITPESPLRPGSSESLTITCSGSIDQRVCFIDLKDERIEDTYRFWLFTVPKLYAFVESECVLLTPEAMWYPVPGLTDGAAYPEPATRNFVRFRLDVEVDGDLVAVSQGAVTADTTATGVHYRFEPESPLPQMSVAIGKYEQRSIEVDSTMYSLFTLRGHDGFVQYFDSVSDTLPYMIRELRNNYEMQIGLEYPYRRLTLVETPIQFYCHDRLWTYAQETMQPQVVLLPELGTICDGTDFPGMKRRSKRRQERANLAETPQETQAVYFGSFVRIDLLGIETGVGSPREDEDSNIEPRFHILPNYVSHSVHLFSRERPLINYALESYIFNKATPPQDVRWRSWQGLTDMERANLLLRDKSLKDIIGGDYDSRITNAVMKEKGRYLFTLLEAQVGTESFNDALTEFLRKHRFADVPADSFLEIFDGLTDCDLMTLVDSWYADTVLPGFNIENIESYKVVDGERVRSQIKFSISNPQPVDGVVTVGFRSGGTRRDDFTQWGRRGLQQFDYERMVIVPAESRKEIGFILDDPPVQMDVETYISYNIPSVLTTQFEDLKLDKRAVPFDGERLVSLDDKPSEETGEYVVDNEDSGFKVVTTPDESRFRIFLLGLFSSEEQDDDPYKGLWFWRPPKVWVATTDSRFYGRFVHSGLYKASGDGSQIVSWDADLGEDGTYEVSYYYPDIEEPRWARSRGSARDKGEQTFLVYHDDGVDEVVLDLNTAEQGWNLLGTYHLSSGEGRIELTDKNTKTIVTADAVKWARR